MFYADLADTVVPFSRLQNQRRPRDRHLLPLACAIPWSHIATSPTDPFWAHPSFSRRMCARAVHACSLRIAIALAPLFATTDGQDQSEFVYGRVPAPSRQPHAIKACSLRSDRLSTASLREQAGGTRFSQKLEPRGSIGGAAGSNTARSALIWCWHGKGYFGGAPRRKRVRRGCDSFEHLLAKMTIQHMFQLLDFTYQCQVCLVQKHQLSMTRRAGQFFRED